MKCLLLVDDKVTQTGLFMRLGSLLTSTLDKDPAVSIIILKKMYQSLDIYILNYFLWSTKSLRRPAGAMSGMNVVSDFPGWLGVT